MKQLTRWVAIARPKTLAAAWAPVTIGLLVASLHTSINWGIAIVTLLCATAIQIISNFVNDYYDYKKGLDKAGRVGFKRALAEGEVTPTQMLRAIYSVTAVALLSGLYLVYCGGVPILLIGLFSLLFAWLYTATSKSLAYLGIADLFVLLFFGPVATLGTTLLQTGRVEMQSFWLGLVCGLISTCVLVVNNVRDYDNDKAHGKRSLPVRFGKAFGEWEYFVAMGATLPCLFLAGGMGITYLLLIPAILLYGRLLRAQGGEYNTLLAQTGKLNLLYAALVAIDLLLIG